MHVSIQGLNYNVSRMTTCDRMTDSYNAQKKQNDGIKVHSSLLTFLPFV